MALPLLRQGVTFLTGNVLEHCRKSLATVTGYQDRFVLCDTFWIDETHINDTDPSKGVFRQEDLSKKSIGN